MEVGRKEWKGGERNGRGEEGRKVCLKQRAAKANSNMGEHNLKYMSNYIIYQIILQIYITN